VKIRPLLYSAAALGALALPGAALAHPRTVALPVHATFGGTVNGATVHATIRMACIGPDRPGRTGHPMGKQTVGVFIPEVVQSSTFGTTGDPARAIAVSIVAGGHRVGPFQWFHRLRLTRPVTSATGTLPTDLTLPCSGTGTAVFAPVPATAGAKPATVDVRFTGQP
jgi:hypothetical protein